MNERIQELAEEAGMRRPVMGEASLARFDYEKFAELIIKECMEQVKGQYLPVMEDKEMMKDTRWDGYVQCGVDSVVAIREHFGVEFR